MSQFPGELPPTNGTTDPAGSRAREGELNDATMVFGAIAPEVSPSAEANVRPLTAEEHAAIVALPQGSALLIMQPGPGAGARFLLDDDRTNAGRSERADIFLDDVTVSRKHAQFIREGTEFIVRDSGSLNGTYVNRERIDSFLLRSGDEVQIGKYRMTFHSSPANQSGSTGRGA